MPNNGLAPVKPSPRLTSRRTFLRAAGLGAAGLAAAPWLWSSAAADNATPVAALGDAAWDDLAGRLRGWLLRPDDAMYPAAAVINAARYAGIRPAGIASA